MNVRTTTVASLVTVSVAWCVQSSSPVLAQACNTSPTRPVSATAARAPNGSVLFAWTYNGGGGCAPTKFYVEAARGTSDIVEEEIEDPSDRSVSLPLAAGNGTPWRINIRAFNANGLSQGRAAVLSEGTPTAPPNSCPGLESTAPTLISANVVGRRLYVAWAPDARCPVAVTNFLVGGAPTSDGPMLGSVAVPYPNSRSWEGDVPQGTYYVFVMAQWYGATSARSNAILVHVP